MNHEDWTVTAEDVEEIEQWLEEGERLTKVQLFLTGPKVLETGGNEQKSGLARIFRQYAGRRSGSVVDLLLGAMLIAAVVVVFFWVWIGLQTVPPYDAYQAGELFALKIGMAIGGFGLFFIVAALVIALSVVGDRFWYKKRHWMELLLIRQCRKSAALERENQELRRDLLRMSGVSEKGESDESGG